MTDAAAITRLKDFFRELDVAITKVREIRSVYDERIAFNFNSLGFFSPNENKISEILAFFLDPSENHGQKAAFLESFAKHFSLREALRLLGTDVKVRKQYRTDKGRLIDIVIVINEKDSKEKYFIGIENKISDRTQDLNGQLSDYAADLRKRSAGHYTLFYLTPSGHDPAGRSIDGEQSKKLQQSGKLRIVGYEGERGIVGLLEGFEMVCKADNVRAFIRDFQQYVRKEFVGEMEMDEQNVTEKLIRKTPEIIRYHAEIGTVIEKLRNWAYTEFRKEVNGHLKKNKITLGELTEEKTWLWWPVHDTGGKPSDGGAEVAVFFEKKKEIFYIGAWGKEQVDNLNAKFRDLMIDGWPGKVLPDDYENTRACVDLPKMFTEKGLSEVVGNPDELRKKVKEAANKIARYVKEAKTICPKLFCSGEGK
ncbi:MAG: PD-(D/E)XK nuclease family protein [Phycisphaerae bacterium]